MSDHWVTRYDSDEGPYRTVCYCETGEDHDDFGTLTLPYEEPGAGDEDG